MVNGVVFIGSGIVSRAAGVDMAIGSSGKDFIKSGRGDRNVNGGKGCDRVMSEETSLERGRGRA